ncbi:hypothetical protein SMICM304S_03940 [Streptomyces microflavus]
MNVTEETGGHPVALVAGASSGIGAAVARRLAARGSAVALVGRREAELKEVAESIRAAGGTALPLPLDLAEPGAPAEAVAATAAGLGPVGLLVCSAGAIRLAAIHETEERHWERQLRINLTVPFLLAREVLPGMRERRYGWVVNIGSGVGSEVVPGSGGYGVSKTPVLRADVWRPADGPASPAVLFRTPYGKSPLGLATLTPAQCVDRGYAAVVQDTRGRFRSEGEWAPLDWSQEGPDGYDTVEWTARQPWCDGNVAMAGTSYQAIVQWLAAMEKPPHLRAIAPTMSTSAPYDTEQLGGSLRLDHLTSWLGLTALEWVQRRAAAGDPVDGAVVAEVVQLLTTPEVPLRRWPLSTILDFEGFPGRLRDIFAGKVATVADYRLGEVGVPTFSVGGWYDVFSFGTIELHRAMRAQDPVAGRHELVVGPWVHSGQLPQVQGEVNTGPYGSAQGARLADLHLDFFDRHLRATGERTADQDPGGDVRYFLFGDDTWHRAASWPPPEAVDSPWYLAGSAGGGDGGRLLPEPSDVAPGHDTFTYDPEDPVPSHGGRVLQLGRLAAGPLNQAHLESRPDVLVYTSEPLTGPLDVVGRQRLRLRFGSDAPATAVVAKLTDVHPDGRSLLVAEASLRLEADGDGPPDEPYDADLLLGDTAWRFAPGHRLRVHVTSSNFPHLDRHPNVPGPVGEAEHCRPARQTVWYGGPYESVLQLRTLPAPTAGEAR